jgi:hypothetical protein
VWLPLAPLLPAEGLGRRGVRGEPVRTSPEDAVENMSVIDVVYRAAGHPIREPSCSATPGRPNDDFQLAKPLTQPFENRRYWLMLYTGASPRPERLDLR